MAHSASQCRMELLLHHIQWKHASLWGWNVAQLVRASDRHAAGAGSIPRCGKGFFSQSQLSVQTLLRCSYTLCAIACIYICAHVKDPVVHVRVRWIMETLKHPACTLGWVARLCCSWLSPGKPTRIFYGRNPIGTIQLQKVLKKSLHFMYLTGWLILPKSGRWSCSWTTCSDNAHFCIIYT